MAGGSVRKLDTDNRAESGKLERWPGVKNTLCSCRGLGFGPQHPCCGGGVGAHNHLSFQPFQFQEIEHCLLASVGTRHACGTQASMQARRPQSGEWARARSPSLQPLSPSTQPKTCSGWARPHPPQLAQLRKLTQFDSSSGRCFSGAMLDHVR